MSPIKFPSSGARALITGLTGQDGYYLAKLLKREGCHVIGAALPAEMKTAEAVRAELGLDEVLPCDLERETAVENLVYTARPTVVYHLAAQSSVRRSWEMPLPTTRVNCIGTLCMLEAIRRYCPQAAFIMAGSCDCFDHEAAGAAGVSPETPFRVTNPYAATKVFAHQMTDCYRNEHGLRAAVAVFFNHTSTRRPEMFVERGIVRNAVRVKLGQLAAVPIGSWETTRDWAWAEDLMEGFAALGAMEHPVDMVLAGGRTLTVRDWVLEAFSQLGLDPETQVAVDASRLHPGDRPHTHGNIARTRELLGWQPSTDLKEMVRRLIEFDLKDLAR